MDKLAQRRGKIDKFKENVNLPGKMMEAYSPELQALMEVLRETDDNIREIASPEGDKANTLKDLLKVAKTNFNRKEYMIAISFLGKFHDKLELVDKELSKLQNSVDAKHYEFLFGDIDPSHIDYLTNGLGEKFNKYLKTPTGILTTASLNKEADVTDWWHNITSDRGKALSAWEKRFPQYVKDLKNQTGLMINKSESLLNFLLTSLKMMSGFRNARKLEDYIKVAKKLQEKFKGYNITFLQFYNKYVKKLIEYQKSESSLRQIMSPEEAAKEMTKPLFNVMVPSNDNSQTLTPSSNTESLNFLPSEKRDPRVTPDSELPTLSRPVPAPISSSPLPFPTPLPRALIDSSSQPDTKPDSVTAVDTPTLLSPGIQRKTPLSEAMDHTSFLQSLAAMEHNHPMVIAKELISYAKSIEIHDAEMSKKLLGIAQRALKG
jgi:hypothetical protein